MGTRDVCVWLQITTQTRNVWKTTRGIINTDENIILCRYLLPPVSEKETRFIND